MPQLRFSCVATGASCTIATGGRNPRLPWYQAADSPATTARVCSDRVRDKAGRAELVAASAGLGIEAGEPNPPVSYEPLDGPVAGPRRPAGGDPRGPSPTIASRMGSWISTICQGRPVRRSLGAVHHSEERRHVVRQLRAAAVAGRIDVAEVVLEVDPGADRYGRRQDAREDRASGRASGRTTRGRPDGRGTSRVFASAGRRCRPRSSHGRTRAGAARDPRRVPSRGRAPPSGRIPGGSPRTGGPVRARRAAARLNRRHGPLEQRPGRLGNRSSSKNVIASLQVLWWAPTNQVPLDRGPCGEQLPHARMLAICANARALGPPRPPPQAPQSCADSCGLLRLTIRVRRPARAARGDRERRVSSMTRRTMSAISRTVKPEYLPMGGASFLRSSSSRVRLALNGV